MFRMWASCTSLFCSSNEMPLFEELRYIIDWGLLSLPPYKLKNHGMILLLLYI